MNGRGEKRGSVVDEFRVRKRFRVDAGADVEIDGDTTVTGLMDCEAGIETTFVKARVDDLLLRSNNGQALINLQAANNKIDVCADSIDVIVANGLANAYELQSNTGVRFLTIHGNTNETNLGNATGVTNLEGSSTVVDGLLTANGGVTVNGDLTLDGGYILEGVGTGVAESLRAGDNAGAAMTTGTSSIVIGNTAGELLTTGTDNVAVGRNALKTMVSGVNNTAVGRDALRLATAYSNTAVGHIAGDCTSDGYENVFVGATSGPINTTGHQNTALGFSSMKSCTTGKRNTCVGWNTEVGATTEGSIALGANSVCDADNQMTIGSSSGVTRVLEIRPGTDAETTLGTSARQFSDVRTAAMTATGLVDCIGGVSTNDVAARAGSNVTIHNDDSSALFRLLNDGGSVVNANRLHVGVDTGVSNAIDFTSNGGVDCYFRANTDTKATSVGLVGQTLTLNGDATAVGDLTVDGALILGDGFIFDKAGSAVEESQTIVAGLRAGDAVTSATDCIFIGKDAGGKITTGPSNVAVGPNALANGVASMNNTTAVGKDALTLATSFNNTAVGSGAAAKVTGVGAENAVFGSSAAADMTTGSRNLIAGHLSGRILTTGIQCTALGYGTRLVTTLGAQIALGAGAECDAAFQMTIGGVGSTDKTTVIRTGLNGACDLGESDRRFKDIHLAGHLIQPVPVVRTTDPSPLSTPITRFKTDGGAITCTLPSAAVSNGKTFVVCLELAGNDLTITAAGADTIGAGTTAVLNVTKTHYVLRPVGTNWYVSS